MATTTERLRRLRARLDLFPMTDDDRALLEWLAGQDEVMAARFGDLIDRLRRERRWSA